MIGIENSISGTAMRAYWYSRRAGVMVGFTTTAATTTTSSDGKDTIFLFSNPYRLESNIEQSQSISAT